MKRVTLDDVRHLLCSGCDTKIRDYEQKLAKEHSEVLRERDEARAPLQKRYGMPIKDCEKYPSCDGFLIPRLGLSKTDFTPYLGCNKCNYAERFENLIDEENARRILTAEVNASFERWQRNKEGK